VVQLCDLAQVHRDRVWPWCSAGPGVCVCVCFCGLHVCGWFSTWESKRRPEHIWRGVMYIQSRMCTTKQWAGSTVYEIAHSHTHTHTHTRVLYLIGLVDATDDSSFSPDSTFKIQRARRRLSELCTVAIAAALSSPAQMFCAGTGIWNSSKIRFHWIHSLICFCLLLLCFLKRDLEGPSTTWMLTADLWLCVCVCVGVCVCVCVRSQQ